MEIAAFLVLVLGIKYQVPRLTYLAYLTASSFKRESSQEPTPNLVT